MTKVAVITCSDAKAAAASADDARAESSDGSGALAVELLTALGHEVAHRAIVPDDRDRIRDTVVNAIDAGCRIVVCTGGTGLGPRDVTPEAIEALGGRAMPGIGEAIRAASRERVPTADLSRTGAVAIGRALVVLLPGSPGGVRDGLAVAGPLLDHAVAMLDGGGHPARGDATSANEPREHLHRDQATDAGAIVDVRGDVPIATGFENAARPGGQPAGPASVGPEPIDAAALAQSVERAAAGAVVTFEGLVRDHDGGRAVTSLTYEAHPDAAAVLAEVVAEAATRPGVAAAVAAHREGALAIGDLAFFVAVAAPHRGEAFAACAWLVDEAKARTPIWKHQVFADGTSEWVNCP